jgi:TetR/AcrR family transcriptional regulator, transcriptional repressor for nem operon
MATKGEHTRERIIHESAALFNVRGYAGTSISDIMAAAQIQKGGLYRHFDSKDELALAAVDYELRLRIEAVRGAMAEDKPAIVRLGAICQTFRDMVEHASIPGGCPILNTAVEADDTLAPLKQRTRQALDILRQLIQEVIAQGKARGEIQPYVNGDVVATVLIATCEGAIMMSQVCDDPLHLYRAIDHLNAYFETLRC